MELFTPKQNTTKSYHNTNTMPAIGIKMSSLNLLENEHYVLNGLMYDVIANVCFHI